MKLFLPAFFLCAASLYGQKAIPSDFKKIPEILDNPELLYPFIIPDRNYQYWSVLKNHLIRMKLLFMKARCRNT